MNLVLFGGKYIPSYTAWVRTKNKPPQWRGCSEGHTAWQQNHPVAVSVDISSYWPQQAGNRGKLLHCLTSKIRKVGLILWANQLLCNGQFLVLRKAFDFLLLHENILIARCSFKHVDKWILCLKQSWVLTKQGAFTSVGAPNACQGASPECALGSRNTGAHVDWWRKGTPEWGKVDCSTCALHGMLQCPTLRFLNSDRFTYSGSSFWFY